ncbi:magnesium transporter [Nocardia nova]|uniref:magnesium transporter n=1 Tax=Nocardia nova TaxID=37330 RepID=UPI001FE9618C|nr:magnesium transporter [Nocardia nova]
MSTDLFFAAPARPDVPDEGRPATESALYNAGAEAGRASAGEKHATEAGVHDTCAADASGHDAARTAETAVAEQHSDHDSLRDLIDDRRVDAALTWLDDHAPHRIADELARMDAVHAGIAFRLLDKDRALAVFEELEPVDQQQILSGMRDQSFRELVEGMDPDDRARMLREAPATVAKKVLAGLSPRERRMTAALLGYPEGSVGRYMTPEVVALHCDLTVEQALRVVRAKGAHAETVYTLPVVDGGRRLTGVVEMRELVLSDPETMLTELVVTAPVFARATDAAEKAARLMRETNLINLPVVDSEDRLVGLLTIDDAVEVIEAADSEDVARQAGASPWSGHYMAAGVFQLARYRAMWLLLLLVAATLTVTVTDAFEATLAQAAHLALFIPLLIGAGGNAGAQAATSCVRALAVGEVRVSDLLKVIWRECRVGLVLGSMLAVVGMVIGAAFVGAQIALVVGITLVIICGWAATIGGTMPLLAKKLRIDPAVISAPMVTTLVDATGLVIYFTTAKLVLGI